MAPLHLTLEQLNQWKDCVSSVKIKHSRNTFYSIEVITAEPNCIVLFLYFCKNKYPRDYELHGYWKIDQDEDFRNMFRINKRFEKEPENRELIKKWKTWPIHQFWNKIVFPFVNDSKIEAVKVQKKTDVVIYNSNELIKMYLPFCKDIPTELLVSLSSSSLSPSASSLSEVFCSLKEEKIDEEVDKQAAAPLEMYSKLWVTFENNGSVVPTIKLGTIGSRSSRSWMIVEFEKFHGKQQSKDFVSFGWKLTVQQSGHYLFSNFCFRDENYTCAHQVHGQLGENMYCTNSMPGQIMLFLQPEDVFWLGPCVQQTVFHDKYKTPKFIISGFDSTSSFECMQDYTSDIEYQIKGLSSFTVEKVDLSL